MAGGLGLYSNIPDVKDRGVVDFFSFGGGPKKFVAASPKFIKRLVDLGRRFRTLKLNGVARRQNHKTPAPRVSGEEENMPLKEDNLLLMNEEQKEVVLLQWEKHQHQDFEVDYDVSGEGDILAGFIVKKNVWDPFLASGRYHAHYLFYHSDLFFDKTVIEIGSGTGLMGIVMAKYGAKKVIMSDISQAAVKNSQANVNKFDLGNVCSVVQGDLFEKITGKADMITWMIPFFAGYPPGGDAISASMIMSPELFEKFLEEAPKYLNNDGIIVIPSFSLGGELTDPTIVAKKFGYRINTTWRHKSINGIQQGMIYMHELSWDSGKE